MWGGKGEPLDIRNGLLKKNTDRAAMADLSSTLPRQDPSELEVSSAAVETAQIKDKLKKRRMSEGIHASSKGMMDACLLIPIRSIGLICSDV